MDFEITTTRAQHRGGPGHQQQQQQQQYQQVDRTLESRKPRVETPHSSLYTFHPSKLQTLSPKPKTRHPKHPKTLNPES